MAQVIARRGRIGRARRGREAKLCRMEARGDRRNGRIENRGRYGLPIVGPSDSPVNRTACILATMSPAECGSTFDALPNLDAQFRQHVGKDGAFLLEDGIEVVFPAVGFDSPQTGAFDPG